MRIADSTKFTKVRRPPRERNLAFQDNKHDHAVMIIFFSSPLVEAFSLKSEHLGMLGEEE